MTEIRDAGALNYTDPKMAKKPAIKADAETPVKPPQDEVTLTKPKKSLGKKIIEFPGKVIKGAAGAAVALVTTPMHAIPGMVKGMNEGVVERKGRGSETSFHLAMYTQNALIGIGAGLAMMGGIWGAVIGGVGMLAFTGVTHWMGDKTEVYDKMIDNIENKVDNALKDNQGTKTEVMFQNLTEGGIIGAGSSMKTGWKVGFEAGKGIVSGVVGAAEGIAEGVYEVGKNIGNKVIGKMHKE